MFAAIAECDITAARPSTAIVLMNLCMMFSGRFFVTYAAIGLMRVNVINRVLPVWMA
ncbi:hypothetical protein GCM10022405_04440 [Gibbsiella dentisursi]|uniref:Uncharacterized protein n=1 Tax=Gibbsiella dentisursi TaxID=796890 RepID=A0ABP7KME9_9GAMM